MLGQVALPELNIELVFVFAGGAGATEDVILLNLFCKLAIVAV